MIYYISKKERTFLITYNWLIVSIEYVKLAFQT